MWAKLCRWCKNGRAGRKTEAAERQEFVVALAGNPNTGKSTIFNALTGLHQHTGNWPGKTVARFQGRYRFKNRVYKLVDLPGTYSLFVNSAEEQVARDFLCFQKPAAVIVVVNAGCLERNLNLVLQIMEITPRVVVCVNLLDEARRKNIRIDLPKLEHELGAPVVGTVARQGRGLKNLQQTVEDLLLGRVEPRPRLPVYDDALEKEIAGLLTMFSNRADLAVNPRWFALRLLEGDASVLGQAERSRVFVQEPELQAKQQETKKMWYEFKAP
ncbi:MAG: iron transporter FeoB [Firmicutes bacterium]|nr:iron transporter FeoB [Bacillota bacterium]